MMNHRKIENIFNQDIHVMMIDVNSSKRFFLKNWPTTNKNYPVLRYFRLIKWISRIKKVPLVQELGEI